MAAVLLLLLPAASVKQVTKRVMSRQEEREQKFGTPHPYIDNCFNIEEGIFIEVFPQTEKLVDYEMKGDAWTLHHEKERKQ